MDTIIAGVIGPTALVLVVSSLFGVVALRCGQPAVVGQILAGVLGSAWITASLGLHPVFGGLLAGLAMQGKDKTPDPDVLRSMEDVSGVLLPLFSS